MKFPILALYISLILVSCETICGQSISGLRGEITDELGAVIPGAGVVLAGNGREWRTTSDSEGKFEFIGIGQGTYSVSVKMSYLDRVITESVTVGDNAKQQVSITFPLGACAGSQRLNTPSLTDADRAEIARHLLTYAMSGKVGGGVGSTFLASSPKFYLVPTSIHLDWLTSHQRQVVKVVTRRQVQRIADKVGHVDYFQILPLKQHGGCIEATITLNVAVKGQAGDANMSGGGAKFEFRRTNGQWVGKFFTGWIS